MAGYGGGVYGGGLYGFGSSGLDDLTASIGASKIPHLAVIGPSVANVGVAETRGRDLALVAGVALLGLADPAESRTDNAVEISRHRSLAGVGDTRPSSGVSESNADRGE